LDYWEGYVIVMFEKIYEFINFPFLWEFFSNFLY
jgi:hypothetical protein